MHNQFKFKENLIELFESKTIEMLAEAMENGDTYIK